MPSKLKIEQRSLKMRSEASKELDGAWTGEKTQKRLPSNFPFCPALNGLSISLLNRTQSRFFVRPTFFVPHELPVHFHLIFSRDRSELGPLNG